MSTNGAFTRTESLGQSRDSTFPRFFMHQEQDPVASEREGRPIFREIEMVEIIMPGIAHLNKPAFKVTDEHRQRWPDHYDRFKKGQQMSLDGTPIEQWPILTRGMVLELKALEIHTVEACATLTDHAIQRIPMYGRKLRDLAKAYLDDADRMAEVTRLTEEKAKDTARMAELENKVAELSALLERTHQQLMDMKNAPSPIAAAVPAASDPAEAARMAQPAAAPSQSALAALDRPRRTRQTKPQAAA